jgi:hypothetical protein
VPRRVVLAAVLRMGVDRHAVQGTAGAPTGGRWNGPVAAVTMARPAAGIGSVDGKDPLA